MVANNGVGFTKVYCSLSKLSGRTASTCERDFGGYDLKVVVWEEYKTMGPISGPSTICVQNSNPCDNEDISILSGLWTTTTFARGSECSFTKRCKSGGT